MCLESVTNKRIVCVQIFGGFNYYKPLESADIYLHICNFKAFKKKYAIPV